MGMLTAASGYHGPPPLTGGRYLTAWTFEPLAFVLVVLALGGYLAGVRKLRRSGEDWPVSRTIAFCALGVGGYAICTMSFLGVYETTLFSVRAIQNILLLMVIPLFLAQGAPISLLVAVLPERGRERLLKVIHSRVAKALTFPACVSILLLSTPFLLYFTSWSELSLRHRPFDLLLHLELVTIGFIYYWTRLRVDPVPHEYPHLVSLWITFAEAISDGALGLTLIFSTHLFAGGYYTALHRPWGPSLHQDQVIGGGALWLIGDLAGVPFVVTLAFRMLREDREQAAEIDEQLDAEEAAVAADPERAQGLQRPWWETDPRFAGRYGDD